LFYRYSIVVQSLYNRCTLVIQSLYNRYTIVVRMHAVSPVSSNHLTLEAQAAPA
jgi:hypothetical protein